MEVELQKLREVSDMVTVYGPGILRALIVLLAGLVLAKLFMKYAKPVLRRLNMKEATLSVLANIVFIVIVTFSLSMSAHLIGLKTSVIIRVLAAVALALVGIVVLFRPLIPTLPFKVGNTIIGETTPDQDRARNPGP